MSTLVSSQIDTDHLPFGNLPVGSDVDTGIETVADLVDRLGDIPLERIRMHPAPGTAVESDVIQMKLCELIDGVVVEKAMSFFESRLAIVLATMIELYLRKNPVGFVVGADAQTRTAPGRIRIPDVSFSRWEKTTDGTVPTEPIGPFAPELAVEILSPGNTKREMTEKRRDLFAAGTQLIWILDPKKKTVSVYRDVDDCRTIESDGALDGEELLPGFSLSIQEWFEIAAGPRRG